MRRTLTSSCNPAGDEFYSFVPHNGLTVITTDEARSMLAAFERHAAHIADDAHRGPIIPTICNITQHRIRQRAEHIFDAECRERGAPMPWGFSFLKPKDQQPYLERAAEQIIAEEEQEEHRREKRAVWSWA
ncbi:MAG TPA: hypothetical protein VG675_12615 [Bryobacteraceae bacterium]|nr:hypothetical protein [Bryobacteraceae bacterium]